MKMLPGMNSRKAAQLMKKMGVQQQEIEATEVIIKLVDKEIIITNPQVLKINMMGQETFQVSGRVSEQAKSEISDEDVRTVMEQAKVSEEKARATLKKSNGDLAEAIMSLQG